MFCINFVHQRPFHDRENIYDLVVSSFVKRSPDSNNSHKSILYKLKKKNQQHCSNSSPLIFFLQLEWVDVKSYRLL